MKKSLIISLLTLLLGPCAFAQTDKQTVYAEVGLGFGQTLFAGDIKSQLSESLGGSFDPASGGNVSMGFYVSPESWKGLGLGSRIHGTFGGPATGEFGDEYIFNYYNLALSAKYYLSQTFNNGLYGRGSIGFGQMTTKRITSAEDEYFHQYAIGTTFTGSIGYTLPFQKTALSLEAQYEYSSRNGTVSGLGDGVRFNSGQIGGNLILSF